MMEENKVKTANTGPLGLLGFGMTTVILNLHNEGIIELSVAIVAMGFAAGGLMQIIAGIFELRRGNTFTGTAFVAYACFWWSLIYIWLNPGDVAAADGKSMGFYLLLWGIFSLFMFFGSLKHTRITKIIFFTLVLLFFGLAISDFTGNSVVGLIAGGIGIFCGSAAIYNAVGQILKEEYNKEILPL